MMNRRSFLQYAGTGLFLIGGLSLMRFEKELGENTLARKEIIKEELDGLTQEEVDILQLASLAPSSHNSQPWFVKVIGYKHWLIGTDKTRWLPAVDPDNREMLLSIGAFIENLDIAAGVYGYDVHVHIVAENAKSTEIAELKLEKSKPRAYALERLKNRRTVRDHFLNKAISKSDLDYITYGYADQIAFCPPDSKEGKLLQEAVIEANKVQIFRDAAQQELSEWIRWSEREGIEHRNGLTPDSMEIKGFDKWFVQHFYDRESVMDKSFRDKTLQKTVEQAKTCGGWLIVTSEDTRPENLVMTGRNFENMLIKARDKMVAAHPMSQVLEEGPWKYILGQELDLQDQVQFVLRLGYLAEYPPPVSLRMPVAWFVEA